MPNPAVSSDFRRFCGRASARQLGWALAFSISLPLATFALHHFSLPSSLRVLIPIPPLVAGVMYILALVRDTRNQMDELQLRIHLEAAVVVVCGLFILMLTYPILQEAGLAPALDYSIVMALLVVLGAGGYLRAWRRYR